MVVKCVAAGCSRTHSDGVSLFKFPKDPPRRQEWTKQVKRTRDLWDGPSDTSVLCSKHFDDSCFEPASSIAAKAGIKLRARLKPDAVPTIFERVQLQGNSESMSRKRCGNSSQACPPPLKKTRTAYENRERARVCIKATA